MPATPAAKTMIFDWHGYWRNSKFVADFVDSLGIGCNIEIFHLGLSNSTPFLNQYSDEFPDAGDIVSGYKFAPVDRQEPFTRTWPIFFTKLNVFSREELVEKISSNISGRPACLRHNVTDRPR